jgi:hypothetical protein
LEISSNLTLEIFNQPFLLEKRIELLIAVKRTGSISKAAKEVPMSYFRLRIDSQKCYNFPIKRFPCWDEAVNQTASYGRNLLQ